MKVSDYIAAYIQSQGVDTVFGYTGGSIADLVDSICRLPNLKFVQNYNEQASAFSANSYAQTTGKVGVAISSSGPGAINLMNGIANAYYDSIACVFITGNAHSLSKRPSDKIRQNAFQETDIVSLVKGITKYAVYIDDEKTIKRELDKAFFISQEGRQGPVLVDIPYDIQRREIESSLLPGFDEPQLMAGEDKTQELLALLRVSKRPLILVGGGCLGAKRNIRRMTREMHIPVVASMRGLDVVPHDDDSYIGFVGSYGNRMANLAVKYTDLLIVLGSRLDERQMGYKKAEFAPGAKIVQVDLDPYELGRKIDCVLPVRADVGEFAMRLLAIGEEFDFSVWTAALKKLAKRYPSYDTSQYDAASFVRQVSDILPDDAVVVVDVGQNQIIAAQVFGVKQNQRFLCSAGLACMGYALPAAIGAHYANGGRRVVAISGDGGLQMNIQELETISREKLPIKIVVLHNNSLGLIRKLQERLFDGRYFASIDGFSCPDLEKLAAAYNIAYCKVETTEDYAKLMGFLTNDSPCLIDAIFPAEMTVNPEPGSSIAEQLPMLAEDERRQIEDSIMEICQ